MSKWKDYIENMRQKPEGDRRRIALIYASLATLAIFALWAYNFTVVLSDRKAAVQDTQAVKSEGDSPFAVFKETFVENVDQIKQGWSNVKGDLRNIQEQIPTPAP